MATWFPVAGAASCARQVGQLVEELPTGPNRVLAPLMATRGQAPGPALPLEQSVLRGRVMRCPRRAVLLAIAAGLVAPCCLSPTLPLPPPGEPTVEQVGEQQYLLSGEVSGPGWVAAINDRTETIEGQITGKDGRYAFVVVALPDDAMRLFYATGGELSSPTEFIIRELLPSQPVEDEPADGGAPAPDGDAAP